MQGEVWVISSWPQVAGLAITMLLAPTWSYWLANKKARKEAERIAVKAESTAAVLAHKTAVIEIEAQAERKELKELVRENSAITAGTATVAEDVKTWQREIQHNIQTLNVKIEGLEEKLDILLVNSAKWDRKR